MTTRTADPGNCVFRKGEGPPMAAVEWVLLRYRPRSQNHAHTHGCDTVLKSEVSTVACTSAVCSRYSTGTS